MTYLATRYDDPDNIDSETVTHPFCSRDCGYDLTFGRALQVFRNCNYRQDDAYEFDEDCANCGVRIPAFIPPEDELREQLTYMLRSMRDEVMAGRLEAWEAIRLMEM